MSVETAVESQGSAARARSGRVVRVVLLLLVVVGVEIAAVWFLLPSPEMAGARKNTSDGAFDEGLDTGEPATREVLIDTFNVTNRRAAAGVIHIAFRLVAVVAAEHEVAFNEAANRLHRARVRQAVVKVARMSSLEDLGDPELSTVKRRIREEVNKVLRKSYITEVVISEFRTLEQ